MKADFDDRAGTWDADPERRERARVIASAIEEKAVTRGGMKALEYGCGTGLVSFNLRDVLADITLADSSPGMLKTVAEKIRSAGAQNMEPLALDLMKEVAPCDRGSSGLRRGFSGAA